MSQLHHVKTRSRLQPKILAQVLSTGHRSLCCGNPPGACNSQACNGLNGICTGSYMGCLCPGVDFNAPSNITLSAGNGNALAASGF